MQFYEEADYLVALWHILSLEIKPRNCLIDLNQVKLIRFTFIIRVLRFANILSKKIYTVALTT